MEKLLVDILEELKFHSRQNDKIMELLGKLRQPCGGQKELAGMMKILEGLPDVVKKSNPFFENMINQIREMGTGK